jgi:hypothetical protein
MNFKCLASILISVLLLSCNKESLIEGYNNTPDGFQETGIIYAKVDGNQFTSDKTTTRATIKYENGAQVIVISGSNKEKEIDIILENFMGIGTYSFSQENYGIYDAYFFEKIDNSIKNYTSPYINGGISGELKVTSYEKGLISGKFNFKAKEYIINYDFIENYKTISSGTFKDIPISQ